jgi:hypothetical protein
VTRAVFLIAVLGDRLVMVDATAISISTAAAVAAAGRFNGGRLLRIGARYSR